jgi:hypothetical protein
MKKIISFVLIVGAILSLTACGVGDVGSNAQTQSSTSSAAVSSATVSKTYSDDLAGIISYLTDNGIIDAAAKPVDMTPGVGFIGALKGSKYTFKYNNSDVTVEVYEYDTSKLNDTAKSVISQIQSNGKVTIMSKEVSGTLSDSGKYLLFYTDNSTDEKNKAQTTKAIDTFKAFKK